MEGFLHITLLYFFHKIKECFLKVNPFTDTEEHGIFVAKSPQPISDIGFLTVKFLGIENNIIHIETVDMLNETLLIKIKPFFSMLDNRINSNSEWLDI